MYTKIQQCILERPVGDRCVLGTTPKMARDGLVRWENVSTWRSCSGVNEIRLWPPRRDESSNVYVYVSCEKQPIGRMRGTIDNTRAGISGIPHCVAKEYISWPTLIHLPTTVDTVVLFNMSSTFDRRGLSKQDYLIKQMVSLTQFLKRASL